MATAAQLAAVQAVYTQFGGGTLTDAQVAAIGPLIDARTDNALADYLSTTPQLTAVASVPVPVFAEWAAATGLLGVIKADAVNPSSPLYNSALAIVTMLGWQTGSLDLSAGDPVGAGNLTMLSAWVTNGTITSAQEAQIAALATVNVAIPHLALGDALNAVKGQ